MLAKVYSKEHVSQCSCLLNDLEDALLFDTSTNSCTFALNGQRCIFEGP